MYKLYVNYFVVQTTLDFGIYNLTVSCLITNLVDVAFIAEDLDYTLFSIRVFKWGSSLEGYLEQLVLFASDIVSNI